LGAKGGTDTSAMARSRRGGASAALKSNHIKQTTKQIKQIRANFISKQTNIKFPICFAFDIFDMSFLLSGYPL
jgi:hypothetical protein